MASVTTTLAAVGSTAGGSETQALCYDELDRLSWAGTSGTGPCGRTGSEGIAGAGYTATYAYDPFDRLTSASVLNGSGVALPNAAQGSYTYGASGHLHAVSSVGSGTTGYSAAYDAAGELTCRAVGASTCTNATPTGQTLGYDALRRLISWQNASTSPTATGAYAYDGGGTRVWQQDTSSSGGVTTTTTTITYILGVAEITSVQIGQAAPSTTATRFYSLPGGVSALRDAAGLSYVASDHLGTPIATLNLDTGAVLGEQLRAPYGQARYAASAQTNGGMRTTYGFTGQREDATAAGSSGLDYFNARYYDPTVGRFTSPDSATGADPLLDGYAYVGGMVESATDPSGHRASVCDDVFCPGEAGETRGTGGDPQTGGDDVTAGEISEIGTVADDPVPETTGRFDPDGQAWERGVAAEGDAAPPETNGRFTADEQGRPTDPPKPPDTQQGKGDGGDGANGGSGGGDSGNSTGSTPSPAPNVSHTSGPANAGNTDAIFGEGTASGSGNVNVFRAVDDDEFQSMEGQFRFGRSGLKYFTTSAESAEDFGSVEMKGLQRPFRVMRGNVPVSRLLGSDVTIGPHFVPGRGWIWEISFEGNPGSPLDFIEWVKEILMLP